MNELGLFCITFFFIQCLLPVLGMKYSEHCHCKAPSEVLDPKTDPSRWVASIAVFDDKDVEYFDSKFLLISRSIVSMSILIDLFIIFFYRRSQVTSQLSQMFWRHFERLLGSQFGRLCGETSN